MVGAIIEIAVGWFVTYKVPGIVGAKDILSTIIKLVGVIILIGGFIKLVYSVI